MLAASRYNFDPQGLSTDWNPCQKNHPFEGSIILMLFQSFYLASHFYLGHFSTTNQKSTHLVSFLFAFDHRYLLRQIYLIFPRTIALLSLVKTESHILGNFQLNKPHRCQNLAYDTQLEHKPSQTL